MREGGKQGCGSDRKGEREGKERKRKRKRKRERERKEGGRESCSFVGEEG